MKDRPGPVTVTRPDGSRFTVPGQEYKSRAAEAAKRQEITGEDNPEEFVPSAAVTQESLEEMVMRTLHTAMRNPLCKPAEQIAAATAAIKFLWIKYRVGPAFGEDLDTE